jgi:hypothetical protein
MAGNSLYKTAPTNALMEHKAFVNPSVTVNPRKLNALAAMTSPIPVLGDVMGLAADAAMYTKEPESRNFRNYLLSAVGALSPLLGAAATKAIFAGPLARTADLTALERAKGMAKLGTPDDKIWRETGWWINTPDGVPRFEISDAAAKVRGDKFEAGIGEGTLNYQPRAMEEYPSNLLRHKKLFDAYPQIDDDYSVRAAGHGTRWTEQRGSLDPDYKIIRANAPNREEWRSTMLHELQHGVQGEEGMAKGGSPYEFLRPMKSIADDYNAQISALNEAMHRLVVSSGEGPLNAAAAAKYEDLMGQRMYLVGELQRLKLVDPVDAMEAAHNQYKKLAGEAESRAVQTRRDMTIPQRRATPPWESYDVPINELIIRR